MVDFDEDEFDEKAYAISKAYEMTICSRCNRKFEEGKEPILLIYPKGLMRAGQARYCSEYCVIDSLQLKLKNMENIERE
jgi:hypothetical protein